MMMMRRQAETTDSRCSPEYQTRLGQPCVPSTADYDCVDLADIGIADVEVVGEDIYGIDVDGDRIACEGGTGARMPNDFGESAVGASPLVAPFALIALSVGTMIALRRARVLHLAAESLAEKRSYEFTLYLTLGVIVPAAILGATTLGLLGFD